MTAMPSLKWSYSIHADNEKGRRLIEESDLLPCPKCKSKDLDVFGNVVSCGECDHSGPRQAMSETVCDWRLAIVDWNNEAEALNAEVEKRG